MEELGSGVRIGEQCGEKSVVGERKNGVRAEVRCGKERVRRKNGEAGTNNHKGCVVHSQQEQ